MVHINANPDLNTSKIIRTGRLNESLHDLCEEPLYITFVARNREFDDAVWKEEEETFMRVVLPYEEVLKADNIDLLITEVLFRRIDEVTWLNTELIKQKLQFKITSMQ